MPTQEEIIRAGVRREVKMMAVHGTAKMVADLGKAAASNGDEQLLALCADFCRGTNALIDAMDAENHAAFESFIATEAEVDQLEALLALGGEEIQGGEQ